MRNNNNLIWIDLEMTGLNPEVDRIIEIATIVTDSKLNILGEGPVFAIHQNEELLAGMDEWNTRQHNQSGLVERVRQSTVDEALAEQKTIAFLSQFLDRGKSPMCGNSICQDRRFLYKYMPKLADFFHYRNLDVSTLKELVKRWNPKLIEGVIKDSKHLALADIKDSIDELIYYRQHFINIPGDNHA
ncbi:oligoribonuclease [Legionella birminghamensis]|uniref:Oligoribonuclease n=1 Tax=Legionella birminghamensis TaxID=28083 RepID=A0A378IDQ1_9GAMM|nr:oligoribonuclease [Legionella birminghamensis]KTC69740.1 oligoribonuclease [Legionella birminghamensis]STX32862.1 oligoribonuclease [Legionella birminghamensis]